MTTPAPSKWEASFAWHWRLLAPSLRLTAQADVVPHRKWRFDFCHFDSMVLIELDGGTFSRGRHGRGGGIEAAYEKCNAATKLGYAVLRYGTKRMERDMPAIVEEVADLIFSRMGSAKE